MAPPATDRATGQNLSRRYVGYAAAALVALIGWRALDDAAKSRMFLINRSPSLPNWAFVVERGATPRRGSVSFFLPPHNALVEAHFGRSPSAFGKYAYGVPGDLVERAGNRVMIRAGGTGRPIEVGRLKPRTTAGEPLEAGPTGMVPKGCYYMGSPHRDGFDSRYAAIGFVCARQIVGVATRVIL